MFQVGKEFPLLQMEDFTSGTVKTLGWEILEWMSEYLGQINTEYEDMPFELTREQALFVLRWYALRSDGTFWYSDRAILERPKGWGKSPLLAALCCAELLGPVRFDYWGEDGEPVGRPERRPHIQIAAVGLDQTDNTYALVMQMLEEGRAKTAYNLHNCIHRSKVELPLRRGIIERVTASPEGREGQRITFCVMDESHQWTPAKHGPQLFEVIQRNAVKMDMRVVETTNAPVPGENSVAEVTYNKAVQDFEEADDWRDVDVLLDTRQVIVENIYDKESAYPALEYVYGDSTKAKGGWINLDRIWKEVTSASTREQVARRFYFNQKDEGVTHWISKSILQACFSEDIHLTPRDKFAMGFSGDIRHSAALVAYRLNDGALFLLGLWERPARAPDDWEVPFTEIDVRVRKALADENCRQLVANPENWQEIVGRWYGDHENKVREFWLTKNKAKASAVVEQLETAVRARHIKWKDQSLARHILQAHTTEVAEGQFLIRRETPHSTKYITAAQAALLAMEAGMLAIEGGALQQEEEHELFSF